MVMCNGQVDISSQINKYRTTELCGIIKDKSYMCEICNKIYCINCMYSLCSKCNKDIYCFWCGFKYSRWGSQYTILLCNDCKQNENLKYS